MRKSDEGCKQHALASLFKLCMFSWLARKKSCQASFIGLDLLDVLTSKDHKNWEKP